MSGGGEHKRQAQAQVRHDLVHSGHPGERLRAGQALDLLQSADLARPVTGTEDEDRRDDDAASPVAAASADTSTAWSARRTVPAGPVHPGPVPEQDRYGLAELLGWTLEHLDEPLTVTDLARQANMSTRTLSRHFVTATATTPLQWLLTERIRRAQELLETTDHSVERIAAATGMGTPTTLRRHFHRTIGVPPDTYRRTFRRPHGSEERGRT